MDKRQKIAEQNVIKSGYVNKYTTMTRYGDRLFWIVYKNGERKVLAQEYYQTKGDDLK